MLYQVGAWTAQSDGMYLLLVPGRLVKRSIGVTVVEGLNTAQWIVGRHLSPQRTHLPAGG